jgi:hypothetical protein
MQTLKIFLSRTARLSLATLALGICVCEAWIIYRYPALTEDEVSTSPVASIVVAAETAPAKAPATTAEPPSAEALGQFGSANPRTDLSLGLSAPVFFSPTHRSIGANLWLGSADLTVAGLAGDFSGNSAAGFPVAVSAIPEPSTYAAFAGVFALGLAAWRRRARTRA